MIESARRCDLLDLEDLHCLMECLSKRKATQNSQAVVDSKTSKQISSL